MHRELRIDRNAFEDIVNAVADLPLQRRGRRAFVFSHRERVLFLHAFLAFGLHVAHMLLLPIIKSPSEVNVVAMLTDLQWLMRELRCNCPLPTVSQRLAGPGGVKISDLKTMVFFPKSKNQNKECQERVN